MGFLRQPSQTVVNISKRTSGLALVEKRAIQTISIAVDKVSDGFSQQSAPVVVGVQRLNEVNLGGGGHRSVCGALRGTIYLGLTLMLCYIKTDDRSS